MGRKRKNSPNMKVYGVPFRVTEMKATTKGQIRWYVSIREPDGSVLHGENVGKLVTAKNMKAEVVIKATESIIRENGERVLEWLRVGRSDARVATSGAAGRKHRARIRKE